MMRWTSTGTLARGLAWRVSLLAAALSIATACASTPARTTGRGLSIVQGLTTDRRAQINVLLPKTTSAIYSIYPAARPERPLPSAVTRHERGFSDWVTEEVTVLGLAVGEPYVIEVRSAADGLLDRRAFKAVDINKKNVRLALVSCLSDDNEFATVQSRLWSQLALSRPDYVFLIGDNVYADYKDGRKLDDVDEAVLWSRYVATRRTLDLYRQDELMPVLAIWDDHDYGRNDGDATYPHKAASRQVFGAFWAQDSDGQHGFSGPGVAHSLRAFGQQFVFLDGRSFLSPPGAAGEATQFGAEQERWLNAQLRTAKGPSWLISGTQFFGAYHRFESYEGRRPASFKKFLNKLRSAPGALLFVSGDRHLSETMRIERSLLGYETFEFTSSGMHARVFPDAWRESKNPRQIDGVSGEYNFMVVDIANAGGRQELKVSVEGLDDKTFFSNNLFLKK